MVTQHNDIDFTVLKNVKILSERTYQIPPSPNFVRIQAESLKVMK